jgi:hypothetical protein
LKAGDYDFGEYMFWDFLGKWKTNNEVIDIITNTFE